MYELIPSNLVTCNDPRYPFLGLELLASIENFEFALFSALHGFYRQAFQALRSALEFLMKGVALELMARDGREKAYLDTIKDMGFDICRAEISKIISNFPNMHDISVDCFRQKNGEDSGGWYKLLYHRLSQYPHSNREYTNTQMWRGIGPVFNRIEFDKFTDCYYETVASCIILVQIAMEHVVIVPPFTELVQMDIIQNNPVLQSAFVRLFEKRVSNVICSVN